MTRGTGRSTEQLRKIISTRPGEHGLFCYVTPAPPHYWVELAMKIADDHKLETVWRSGAKQTLNVGDHIRIRFVRAGSVNPETALRGLDHYVVLDHGIEHDDQWRRTREIQNSFIDRRLNPDRVLIIEDVKKLRAMIPPSIEPAYDEFGESIEHAAWMLDNLPDDKYRAHKWLGYAYAVLVEHPESRATYDPTFFSREKS